MTGEEAADIADELNRTGKHCAAWFYYAARHNRLGGWFVCRRPKMTLIMVAVYVTGEVSKLEASN